MSEHILVRSTEIDIDHDKLAVPLHIMLVLAAIADICADVAAELDERCMQI